MIKRVGLFLLTNLLVIATVSIVMSLFGVQGYLTKHGINYTSLAIFTALWGTGGAFISLMISKWMAIHAMGVRVINPETASGIEKQLLQTVDHLAQRAGLVHMPAVGIYDAEELNAFATGPSKKKSLVAVSSGLMHKMNHEELEGVIGHELSHIANGDMVTMTLIQGIVNAFAMFLSRIAAYFVSLFLSGDDEDGAGFSYMTFYVLTFIFDILFTLLGSLVTAAFSRWREYRADKGGAQVAGKHAMIAALEKLQQQHEPVDNRAPSLATLKISHKTLGLRWFASHPSLSSRIAKLTHPF